MLSAVSPIMYHSEVGATLITWGEDRLYTKKKEACCQNCARASVSAAPHLFSTKTLKEKSKVHVSVGADWTWMMCVKWPGPWSTDKRFPVTPCSLGVGVQCRRSLNGKIFCPNNGTAAVSAMCPERLSSAVHIVFEQLALICHLVEGAFVAPEREALCSYQWRVHLGSHRWTETNEETMLFISSLVHFIGMPVYQTIWQKYRRVCKFYVPTRLMWITSFYM